MAAVGLAWLGSGGLRARTVSASHPAPQVTKAQSICLDPGHGGNDPGAQSHGLNESDLNLQVALQVRDRLQNQGYRVFMTRTTNDSNTSSDHPTMTNRDRYTYCNQMHATILVSIHQNFFSDPAVDYDTALFFKDSDQALATSILNATAPVLNLPNNGIMQFEDGVLSESNMPAALSEALFVTSGAEHAKLTAAGSTRLSDQAKGIVQGIINYFTQPHAAPAPAGTYPVVDRSNG